jgi:diadenylate cyclase
MEAAKEILLSLRRYVSNIEFGDILEILIIAYLVYHIMLWIKTTRAWALLKGLIVIAVFGALAFVLKMQTILWLAENVLGYAVMALLIVLQPELRKALEELGKKNLMAAVLPFDSTTKEVGISVRTIDEITRACVEMGKVKTGALIVIEGQQSLVDYERTGIDIDAIVTSQLLINIFEHNTPLHDGAVIVRNNRVTSATCYLPLTDNDSISKEVGTRHRAGVGISEATDSITVIVSEQTGKISVALDGRLERGLDGESLKLRLKEFAELSEQDDKKEKKEKKTKRTLFGIGKEKGKAEE